MITGLRPRPEWTTVDLLRAVAQQVGDAEAYVDAGTHLTFGGWDAAADGVAAGLRDLGVRPGDVVCLLLPSSADHAVCYQATMRLRAVTSAVNGRLGPREVASIIGRTRPRVTVVPDGSPVPPNAGTVVPRSALAAMARASRDPGLPRPRPDDVVAVVWTSGTTADPKGAVFDHARLRATAGGAGVLTRPHDRRLNPLPFAHVGYATRAWDEIASAVTTVITPTPWTAREALRLLESERVTVAQGVPAQWELLLRCEGIAAADLSALRLASTGGARVDPALVRAIRARTGCPVVVRYASTEASILSSTAVDAPPEVTAATVGRASAGVTLQVVDGTGTALPPGVIGQVRARSAAVMLGYWQDPEATAAVLDARGWLRTGDLGSLEADGVLTLVGRAGDMYVRGGYNVHPAAVEEVLARHPGVRQVAVVGVPDPVLGEVGVACVVGDPAGGLDGLRAAVRAELADYKAPDRLLALTALPLTGMHKVDRRALRGLAAAG